MCAATDVVVCVFLMCAVTAIVVRVFLLCAVTDVSSVYCTSVSETIRASVSVSTPRRPPNASTVTCFQSILLPVAMSTGVHAATTTSLTMCTPMYSTTRLPQALLQCVCVHCSVCGDACSAQRVHFIYAKQLRAL
jgi:hypothetical protein